MKLNDTPKMNCGERETRINLMKHSIAATLFITIMHRLGSTVTHNELKVSGYVLMLRYKTLVSP